MPEKVAEKLQQLAWARTQHEEAQQKMRESLLSDASEAASNAVWRELQACEMAVKEREKDLKRTARRWSCAHLLTELLGEQPPAPPKGRRKATKALGRFETPWGASPTLALQAARRDHNEKR